MLPNCTSTKKEQLKGVAKRNKASRDRAFREYYENPSICQECGKVIQVKGKVPSTRRKKFCDKSCSASHSNRGRRRWPEPQPKRCPVCKTSHHNRGVYCSRPCRTYKTREALYSTPKGTLFSKRRNWQSARSTIQEYARKAYEEAGLPLACLVCGYVKHYEVSHIKSVASFPDSAKVGEINTLENLVALCPNHHWEFDHGLLTRHYIAGLQNSVKLPPLGE